jgi:hypothetical protein
MAPGIALLYFILKAYPDLQKGVIWTGFFILIILTLAAIGVLFFIGMDKLFGK